MEQISSLKLVLSSSGINDILPEYALALIYSSMLSLVKLNFINALINPDLPINLSNI